MTVAKRDVVGHVTAHISERPVFQRGGDGKQCNEGSEGKKVIVCLQTLSKITGTSVPKGQPHLRAQRQRPRLKSRVPVNFLMVVSLTRHL